MKLIYKIADAANTLLMIIVALFAMVLMFCGLYVLNDIYYTNRTAFVSYDLLKYRPVPKISDDAENEVQSFDELKEINPDAVGWIEMLGTNINYPVVQGKDNTEYLNKDIFGYSTLSGSIYLAAENNSGFNDWYNIIYGHHMDNGAMFGDIKKYLDPDFFASHSEGILQTEQGDYSIRVIACVRTNAYEDAVYSLQDSAEDQYPQLYDYIMNNYININSLPENIDNIQILGLSTCTDAVTDGRIVLFASVSPWDNEINGNIAEKMTRGNDKPDDGLISLTAEGHQIKNEKWAVLNLLCVLCTFLTLMPLWALRSKYRQFSYSKKMIRKIEDKNEETETNSDKAENDTEKKIISNLKHFIRKGRTGLVIELLIFIAAAIVFIITENLRGRMGISDKWTGIMILIASAALAADIIFLRYRGIRPDIETKEQIRT